MSATIASATYWVLPVLLTLALVSGCERKVAGPGVAAAVPEPAVAIGDVPAPQEAVVVVAAGSNLGAIATAAYGHERFAGFIAAVNRIPNPERIPAGTTLSTPSLAVAFRDAGADAAWQPALNILAKACTDYHAVEPVYLDARRRSGVDRGRFAIPPEIAARLVACADAVDAGVAALSTAKEPHAVPALTIGQFKQASAQIRELATGKADGYGYDHDLVGQRFGLAFSNAMVWVREHHR